MHFWNISFETNNEVMQLNRSTQDAHFYNLSAHMACFSLALLCGLDTMVQDVIIFQVVGFIYLHLGSRCGCDFSIV